MTLSLDVLCEHLDADSSWTQQFYAWAAMPVRVDVRGPRVRPSLAVHAAGLTLTQKRGVSRWLASGKPPSEIARRLGISTSAVVAYRKAKAST